MGKLLLNKSCNHINIFLFEDRLGRFEVYIGSSFVDSFDDYNKAVNQFNSTVQNLGGIL